MYQAHRYIKSLITIGVISGTLVSAASIKAQELPPHNLASLGEEYATHTDGILPIVQPYRNMANINDAYLVLNGKTIPAKYDFVLQALVFLPQYEVDIADGFQQGNIVIDSNSGDLIHQPIQFYFDGSAPIATIHNEGSVYRVVVEDPDGFTSVEVQGSGIHIPPIMTWEKPQTRVEFTVTKTSTTNRIEVIAKKPVRRFDPLLFNLNEHRANLVDIDSLPFNQLRNEAINAEVCENDQECSQDDIVTVLANIAENIGVLRNRFERLPKGYETVLKYGLNSTRLNELTDFLKQIQNTLQRKDCTEAERQKILKQIRQIQSEINQISRIEPRLIQEIQALKQQHHEVLQEAQNHLKSAEESVLLAQDKLNQKLGELDSMRRRCLRYFSSLPGASQAPTNQWTEIPDYGGRVYLSDPEAFSQAIGDSSVREQRRKCGEKLRSLRDEVRQYRDNLEQAEDKFQEATEGLNEVKSQQAHDLLVKENQLGLLRRQKDSLEAALDTLRDAAERCQIYIRDRNQQEAAERQRLQQERREQQALQQISTRLSQPLRTRPDKPVILDDNVLLAFTGKAIHDSFETEFFSSPRTQCNCADKAMVAYNNATSGAAGNFLASTLIGIGSGVVTTLPIGRTATIVVSVADALLQGFYSNSSVPTNIVKNLAINLAGDVFPEGFLKSLASNPIIQQATSLSIDQALSSADVKVIQRTVTTVSQTCPGNPEIEADILVVYNPKTATGAVLVRVTNCPRGCPPVLFKFSFHENGSIGQMRGPISLGQRW